MMSIERAIAVLWIILAVICGVLSNDVNIYRNNKNFDIVNSFESNFNYFTDPPSLNVIVDKIRQVNFSVSPLPLLKRELGGNSKTSKRGISSTKDNKRSFGLGALGSSRHGDYDSGSYGGSGGGYSQSGSGGYLEDERLPPIYETGGSSYHHSGGGYTGTRPTSYGLNYRPHIYQTPSYLSDYEDNYYSGHNGNGGGSAQEIGRYKMQALKKFLLPLAGLAILGVAAAASQNSVLLPLGSLNGRKRRSLRVSSVYPSNPIVKPFNA